MSNRKLLPADLARIEERHNATPEFGVEANSTSHKDRGLLLAAVRFYESERTHLADSRREQGELAIKAETERDEAQAALRMAQGELGQSACVIRDQNRRTAMIEREALAVQAAADTAKAEVQRRGLMLDAISKIVRAAGWPMKAGDDEVSQTRRAVKAMKDTAIGQQKRANKLDTEFLRLQTDYLRGVEKIISLEQGIQLYRNILHPCERPAGQDSTAARVASDEWTADHARLNHVPRWTPPTCVHGAALSDWCDKCHDNSMGNRVIKNTAPDPCGSQRHA